ncbi:hypothetical protein CPB86DRAFT_798281 [Serendipita vermifera]|nr:hypothetical protein CPB86DRAFT_798281 [Serendipita vermifera]
MHTVLLSLLSTILVVAAETIWKMQIVNEGSSRNNPPLIAQLCIQAAGGYDGAPVIVSNCLTDSGHNIWTLSDLFRLEGETEGVNHLKMGERCLDVTDGSDIDGNKLQIWPCINGNKNQIWDLNGGMIRWHNHNKCLDLTDGKEGNKIPVIPINPGSTRWSFERSVRTNLVVAKWVRAGRSLHCAEVKRVCGTIFSHSPWRRTIASVRNWAEGIPNMNAGLVLDLIMSTPVAHLRKFSVAPVLQVNTTVNARV